MAPEPDAAVELARPVRIAKPKAIAASPEGRADPPAPLASSEGPDASEATPRVQGTTPAEVRQTAGPTGRAENSVALRRNLRIFLWGFSLPGLALWGVFMALVLSSPYPAIRAGSSIVLALTLVLIAVIALGYAFTLGRTPIRFRFHPTRRSLAVQALTGGWDRFRIGPEAFQVAVEVHPPDLFSRETTELVEVTNPPYRRRRWVVERQLLDPWLPRHPASRPGRSASRAVEEERES